MAGSSKAVKGHTEKLVPPIILNFSHHSLDLLHRVDRQSHLMPGTM